MVQSDGISRLPTRGVAPWPLSAGRTKIRHGESLLVDHLVRAGEDRRRDGEAQCLCRLQVDDQLELRRLLHGQVGGLGAVRYFIDVTADLTRQLGTVGAEFHEAARFDAS